MRGHNAIGEINVLSQTAITAMHVKHPITRFQYTSKPWFYIPTFCVCMFYGLFVLVLAKFP